jgi:hypothetical protein
MTIIENSGRIILIYGKFHPDGDRTGFIKARRIEGAAVSVIFIRIFSRNLENSKSGFL